MNCQNWGREGQWKCFLVKDCELRGCNMEKIYSMLFSKVYPCLIAKAEQITEPVMQEIRYLDKLVDELAKGKTMDKILRK